MRKTRKTRTNSRSNRNRHSSSFKKHSPFLNVLKNSPTKIRKSLLKSAPKKNIRFISECCLNVLKGNVKIKPSAKRRLTPYKSVIRNLVKPKVNIEKRRKLLVQKGGFLPLLLGSLLSGLLGTLIPH